MNRIFTRTVTFDFDGNYIIEIPNEISDYLELQDNDIVVFEVIEDKISIRKRKDL